MAGKHREPVSCVMPTTARRRWCIPWAIEYFTAQICERGAIGPIELLIVGDGADTVGDLVPRDKRIRYLHAESDMPLGAKFNLGVARASYDLVALWADDDYHAPWRLDYQAAQLVEAGREICGLRKMLFHRIGGDTTWLYERVDDAPFFMGGSVLFRRSYWQRHGFDAQARRHADAAFTNAISPLEYARCALALDDYRYYVAINHDDNTGRKGTVAPAAGEFRSGRPPAQRIDRWSVWPEPLDRLIPPAALTRYVAPARSKALAR